MVRPNHISINLKAQVSAWLLMAVVLATVVPFNLFHSHAEKEPVAQLEGTNEIENHHACDHQVHLAEEQEICFLCHFSFVPVYKTSSLAVLEELSTSPSLKQNTLYSNCYSFISIYSVLNKGSPIA